MGSCPVCDLTDHRMQPAVWPGCAVGSSRPHEAKARVGRILATSVLCAPGPYARVQMSANVNHSSI